MKVLTKKVITLANADGDITTFCCATIRNKDSLLMLEIDPEHAFNSRWYYATQADRFNGVYKYANNRHILYVDESCIVKVRGY